MWGASEVGGARINTEQNAYQLKKLGIDSVSVKAFADLNDDILALFALSGSVDALDAKITPVFDAWKKAQTPETHKALHTTNLTGPDLFKQYNGLYNLPWMRYFISYDAKKDLALVKCPVLAINGTKDTQVDATANLGLIKEILTKSGNKNVEVRPLEGLNHLLQTADTGDVSEYEKIDETMAPSAMKIIADWIKIHTK